MSCLLYVWFVCVLFVPSVLWYCWLGVLTCKNRLPYNLYCVGGDVKHCWIHFSAANCIAPDLCEKNCCVSSYACCGLHFLHRWKKFHSNPNSQHSKWFCDVAANQLLRTRLTVSKSLMVSTAVSKLGCSGLVFVDPGTKINGRLQIVTGWTVVETTADSDPLTVQFGHFCCLFIGKVELSCFKVKCVHMKQVWWYIKYTFCYLLFKVMGVNIIQIGQGTMALLLK